MCFNFELLGIVEFVFGSGPHVLAVSDIGEVFSWGHNGYGQLGQGAVVPLTTSSTGGFPQRIQAALSGKKLVKVACGGHHTVALTTKGEVKCSLLKVHSLLQGVIIIIQRRYIIECCMQALCSFGHIVVALPSFLVAIVLAGSTELLSV